MLRKLFGCAMFAGLGLMAVGCVSDPMRTGAKPGREYEVVGKAEGSGGSFMLLQFIPIQQNQRFNRAYREAVENGGGDDLINMELSERWYWAYIGDGFITTVRGDVIRYKKPATQPAVAPAAKPTIAK